MNQYHYLLPGLLYDHDNEEPISSIKQEECSYDDPDFYPTPPASYIPYECSNLASIVSQILNIPEESVDWIARSQPPHFDQLMMKARRKLVREKARNRTLMHQEIIPQIVQTVEEPKKAKRGRKPLKILEKTSYASDNERQKDKKAIQMIRNRISAQNSRDRKKAYLKELEDHTYQCEVENAYLKQQIEEFQRKNKELQLQNHAVQKCISLFMNQCKSSQNEIIVNIAQQLQSIQEDSDTNPEENIQSKKKIKINY